MKNFVNEYLRFSRKERIGVIVLLLLICAFLVLPEVYIVEQERVQPDSALVRLFTTDSTTVKVEPSVSISSKSIRYFYFDPNTIAENEWQELGLPPKVIRTLLNYRSKGGTFKQANDLRKIWGLSKELADSLLPYVRIAQQNAAKNFVFNTKPINELPSIKRNFTLDVNTATVEEWEALPGIGTVLANRIIKYRTKLGGFSNIEQVQKTYGISDTVFQLIKPMLRITIPKQEMVANTDKPSINSASANALEKAGVRADIAAAIVLYRKQNGPYQQMEDLKKIVFVNEAIYQSILPLVRL